MKKAGSGPLGSIRPSGIVAEGPSDEEIVEFISKSMKKYRKAMNRLQEDVEELMAEIKEHITGIERD
jgi:prefoldin subunit 5